MTKQMDFDELFRRFIRGVLHNGVLTQEELARCSGVSRSCIAHWLAGNRSMTLKNASKLIGLFGYDRILRFLLIQQGAATRPERGDREPELIYLLEQINVVLKRMLQERAGEGHDDGEVVNQMEAEGQGESPYTQ